MKILSWFSVYSGQALFNFFCFSLYEMVDGEYSIDNYKSSTFNIREIIENLEILIFVPDNLKTEKMV